MGESENISYMFEASLLDELDMTMYDEMFKNPEFNYRKPNTGLILRPLSTEDYLKGFTNVLAQLTKIGTITQKDFINRFNLMKKAGTYYIIVIEDTNANEGCGKIVACGTVCVEHKFIHSCATRGRVEEVVVDEAHRGKSLGKIILGSLSALSKKIGCYKTTLECKDKNIPFYEKFGYVVDNERFLQQRFRD